MHTLHSDRIQQGLFSKCTDCGYHEAGHILFAYLCGYRCRYAELIGNNEDDFTSIALLDYGKDEPYASKFIGRKPDIETFRCMALGEKMESIDVGRRLTRIFLGGSVAVAVYRNEGNIHIPLPMQIDYLDLIRVEYIHYVLKELSSDQEDDYIEQTLQDALYTLSNINIWTTIDDLAKRLLHSNQLSMNDIEECLDEHGINYQEGTPLLSDL